MSAGMDVDCHYGDHYWVGGSCSHCNKQFRCIYDQFSSIKSIETHLNKYPIVLTSMHISIIPATTPKETP